MEKVNYFEHVICVNTLKDRLSAINRYWLKLLRSYWGILFVTFLLVFNTQTGFSQATATYLDASQPVQVRINDLISKLTLEEKVNQLMYNSPAIPRLNIPAYNWWNEALHGVGRSGVATVFPQAIGMGATFDDDLILKISSAISDEGRAMYNAAAEKGYFEHYGGLTFWTPNINIFRDPRWGRGQETYGEDPVLTSRIGTAFVKGLQGNNPKYLKTAACAKHFAVHSGPEKLRHSFDAVVSRKDLRETYLPAFKKLVDIGVESVMCAYNRTNGSPCCGSNFLIDTVLRKEWGFKGHVVTDCWAVTDFYEGHKVVKTKEEAAAMSVKSGINLNCGDEFTALLNAVKQGLITESEIDKALATLLNTRFKLGLFDSKESNPYNAIPYSVINSPAHRKLAREAAVKSMVLLKNNGVLPLKNDLSKYFITGPTAADVDVLLGNYYGVSDNLITVLEGIAAAIKPGSQLQYRKGIMIDKENVMPIDWTTGTARAADATFLVMGISGLLEGEEGESIASPFFGDRLDYNIPKHQIEFLKKLRENNKKPIITIITGGSPMNLKEVHELSDAVLLIWYPGEEGGNAVADIVFGRTSPSGKLPITFPQSLEQLPAYEDYSMKGRTYRYMESDPMYPFGYGLSFGKFEYSGIQVSTAKVKKEQPVEVTVLVSNVGDFDAEETVQLYITNLNTKDIVPLYSLKDFKKVHLARGESRKVAFTVTPEMMRFIDKEGNSILAPGAIKVTIGGAAPCKRSVELGISKPQEVIFTIK